MKISYLKGEKFYDENPKNPLGWKFWKIKYEISFVKNKKKTKVVIYNAYFYESELIIYKTEKAIIGKTQKILKKVITLKRGEKNETKLF